jgi:hypothetical protein
MGQAKHVAELVAPVAEEYVPAGQLVQELAPGMEEYFPAGQSVHGPPLIEV